MIKCNFWSTLLRAVFTKNLTFQWFRRKKKQTVFFVHNTKSKVCSLFMCVCRTDQTKGWIEQSRVKVIADILSSGELKHKNTSLCSLCALTALPLPPLNMPSYPLIELHPDSTFDHRGEATITHNEYSHLITRCWKYSSHNLAISQSNGSFSGANSLNSAAIQIDRAGGNGKQKKRVPSSAF